MPVTFPPTVDHTQTTYIELPQKPHSFWQWVKELFHWKTAKQFPEKKVKDLSTAALLNEFILSPLEPGGDKMKVVLEMVKEKKGDINRYHDIKKDTPEYRELQEYLRKHPEVVLELLENARSRFAATLISKKT